MVMQFSNREEKKKQFGVSKRNNRITKSKDFYMPVKNQRELTVRGFEDFKHSELREFQRYATCSAAEKEILKLIRSDKDVVIRQDEETQTVLVRFLNRYYVVVADIKCRFIKTFLPDTGFELLEYVQKLIDKENLNKIKLAFDNNFTL